MLLLIIILLLVIVPHLVDPYLVILKKGQVPQALRESSLAWPPSWHVLVQLLGTLPHLRSFQILLLHCYLLFHFSLILATSCCYWLGLMTHTRRFFV